ncbi:hypothetical protein ACH4D3_34920 [Streptomyces sp. NPDC018026]|uniref:hypothetical protein n=1 Tax=Streptomyces sp. NPDC018026 TaxID=3365031 RepID=UPI003788C7BC
MTALQQSVGNVAVQRVVGARPPQRVPARGRWPTPVQRTVAVNGKIYSNSRTDANEKNHEPLWKDVEAFARSQPPERQKEFDTYQTAMKQQLVKWIDDQGTGEKNVAGGTGKHHPLYGRKARNHSFPEVGQLYASLLGWVRQKSGRHREKELAQDVKGNDELELNLDILMAKVHGWVKGIKDHEPYRDRYPKIIEELKTGLVGTEQYGTYRTHFDVTAAKTNPAAKTGINGNMLAVLEKPEKYDMRDKVVVLHDVMEYFLAARHGDETAGSGILEAPTADQKVGTSSIDADGKRTGSVPSKGMSVDRNLHFITRDEQDATTALARQNNIPVWVGQSETTARMMNLGAKAGAYTQELGAAAWALFAFWRLDYDHTVTWGYHTLHEVLDMASNFGVEYNALDREKGLEMFQPGGRLQMLSQWREHLAQEVPKLEEPVRDHDRRAAASKAPSLAGHLAHLKQMVGELGRIAKEVEAAAGAGDREKQRGAMRKYALRVEQAIQSYQHVSQTAAASAAPPRASAGAGQRTA